MECVYRWLPVIPLMYKSFTTLRYFKGTVNTLSFFLRFVIKMKDLQWFDLQYFRTPTTEKLYYI